MELSFLESLTFLFLLLRLDLRRRRLTHPLEKEAFCEFDCVALNVTVGEIENPTVIRRFWGQEQHPHEHHH